MRVRGRLQTRDSTHYIEALSIDSPDDLCIRKRGSHGDIYSLGHDGPVVRDRLSSHRGPKTSRSSYTNRQVRTQSVLRHPYPSKRSYRQAPPLVLERNRPLEDKKTTNEDCIISSRNTKVSTSQHRSLSSDSSDDLSNIEVKTAPLLTRLPTTLLPELHKSATMRTQSRTLSSFPVNMSSQRERKMTQRKETQDSQKENKLNHKIECNVRRRKDSFYLLTPSEPGKPLNRIPSTCSLGDVRENIVMSLLIGMRSAAEFKANQSSQKIKTRKLPRRSSSYDSETDSTSKFDLVHDTTYLETLGTDTTFNGTLTTADYLPSGVFSSMNRSGSDCNSSQCYSMDSVLPSICSCSSPPELSAEERGRPACHMCGTPYNRSACASLVHDTVEDLHNEQHSDDESIQELHMSKEDILAEYSYALNIMKNVHRLHGSEEQFEEMVFEPPIDIQNRDIADHNDAADGVIWMAQSSDVDYISRMNLLSNEITFEKSGWLNKSLRPVGCKTHNRGNGRQFGGTNLLKVAQMDAYSFPPILAKERTSKKTSTVHIQDEVYSEFESMKLITSATLFPEIWESVVTLGIPIILYHIDIAKNAENDSKKKRKSVDNDQISGVSALLTVCPNTTHIILLDTTSFPSEGDPDKERSAKSKTGKMFPVTSRRISKQEDLMRTTREGHKTHREEIDLSCDTGFVPIHESKRTYRHARESMTNQSAVSTHRNSAEFSLNSSNPGLPPKLKWRKGRISQTWQRYSKSGVVLSGPKRKETRTIITVLTDCMKGKCVNALHHEYHSKGYPRNMIEAAKLHDIRAWRFPIERLKSFNLKQDDVTGWVRSLRNLQKNVAKSTVVPLLDLEFAQSAESPPRIERADCDLIRMLETTKHGTALPQLPWPKEKSKAMKKVHFIDRSALMEIAGTDAEVGSTTMPESGELHKDIPEILIFSDQYDIRIVLELLCIAQTQNQTGSGWASRPIFHTDRRDDREIKEVDEPPPSEQLPASRLSSRMLRKGRSTNDLQSNSTQDGGQAVSHSGSVELDEDAKTIERALQRVRHGIQRVGTTWGNGGYPMTRSMEIIPELEEGDSTEY